MKIEKYTLHVQKVWDDGRKSNIRSLRSEKKNIIQKKREICWNNTK